MPLVEKHDKDVFFLVDTNFTYVQAIMLRVRWLRALPYEVDVDEILEIIIALLAKDLDKNVEGLGTYEEAKARITIIL